MRLSTVYVDPVCGDGTEGGHLAYSIPSEIPVRVLESTKVGCVLGSFNKSALCISHPTPLSNASEESLGRLASRNRGKPIIAERWESSGPLAGKKHLAK